jgi:uncharacterized coiled-coil protein SlyX
MNRKEAVKFTKEHYVEIAELSIRISKSQSAKYFGVSTRAVNTCLHRYGRDDLVPKSALKRFNISPIKKDKNYSSKNSQYDFWEKLTENISENPGKTLFDALKKIFYEISVKDQTIKDLNQIISNQRKTIEDIDEKLKKYTIELELVKQNYHSEQNLNRKLVLEAAKSALMVSGD